MKKVIKVRLKETSGWFGNSDDSKTAEPETPFYSEIKKKCKKMGLKYTEYPGRKFITIYFPEQPDSLGGAPYIPFVHLDNQGKHINLTVRHSGAEVWSNPSTSFGSLCGQIRAMISRFHLSKKLAEPAINLFENMTAASSLKVKNKKISVRIEKG
jgi:hypothetical protein